MTTQPPQMTKQFLTEQQLIEDSFRLGVRIYESGFRPNFIVGLWRGGSTVGIYVQECLQTLGVEADHFAVRTSYRGLTHYPQLVASPDTEIRVHGTNYLVESLNADDRLLIVDDAFSTGLNVDALLQRLRKHLKRNMPEDTRIAALYERPSANRTGLHPDFSLHQTEDWLVFPYEMTGLSRQALISNKPFLGPILDTVNRS